MNLLSVFAWALAVAVVFKTLLTGLYDPDLWWHLASGRAMIESGRLLKTDIFSFTMNGAEWVNFEWAFQLAAYLVYKGFGFTGLYGAKILFCWSALFWMAVSLRTAGARGPWVLLLFWLGFLVLKPRLFERAELITLNGLPFLVALLLWARRRNPGEAAFVPWTIFILSVVWVNVHAGYVYGMALVFTFAIGARWTGETHQFISLLDRTLTLMFIALLVNPYGPNMIGVYIEHLVEMNRYKGLILEWGRPTVKLLPFFWALFILTITGLAWRVKTADKRLFFWIPALILFSVWGTLSYRNTALFPFLALPFLAETIEAGTNFTFSGRWFVPDKHWVWCVCLIPIFFNGAVLKEPFRKEIILPRVIPKKACEFLRDHKIQGRLYNSFSFGGIIEWFFGSQTKVFSDGRYIFLPILFEERKLDDSVARGLTRSDWPQYLKKWGVDYALTEPSGLTVRDVSGAMPFPVSTLNAMFPRKDWALVFWDDISLIFLKRIPRFRPLIEKYEYKTLWPYSQFQTRYLVLNGQISRAEFERELRRHHDEVGFTMIGNEFQKFLTSLDHPESAGLNKSALP